MRERCRILRGMPDLAPLASSWAKFRRADAHADALNAELTRIREDADAFVFERQFERREAVLVVTRVPDMRDAGLMLGDAVNCYRAVLDHLVWDLVKMGTHPTLTAQQAKQVQFPFAKSAEEFARPDHRTRRAPGIADRDWRLIRSFQPYRRDHRGRAMRRLRDLSDTDKHRFIYPAFYVPTAFVGNVRLTNCSATGLWMRRPKRPLDVGAKLTRVRIVPTGSDHDVQFESQLTLQPSLDRGVALGPALVEIRETVKAILSAFEERIA